MFKSMMKLKRQTYTIQRRANGSKLPKNGSKYISNHAIQIGSKETVDVSVRPAKVKLYVVSGERRLGRVIGSYLPISKEISWAENSLSQLKL